MAGVIVTGTSRGIGFELVRWLSVQGHAVLALSRNPEPITQLNLPGVTAKSFDLTESEACEGIAKWVAANWGTAGYLIHNAGSLINKPFSELTSEDFEAVYRVNVFGVAALSKALLPVMDPKGHVVVISSMGGVQGSAKFPGLAAYSSSIRLPGLHLMHLPWERYKLKCWRRPFQVIRHL
jgi:3-oxoacyl-[acyl-carrier protein] reductase